jgi:hypothetical protein
MSTEALLSERGTTHGRFADNAHFGQALRALWRTSRHWAAMPEEHREALDHFAGKLSRILSGQSTFKDHWDDIGGYAHLASEACRAIEVMSLGPGVSVDEQVSPGLYRAAESTSVFVK